MLPRSDVAERSQAQTAQIDAQANALGVQASQNAVQNVMGGIDMGMRNARANQMLRMQEAQMRFQASIEEGRGRRADRGLDLAERQLGVSEEQMRFQVAAEGRRDQRADRYLGIAERQQGMNEDRFKQDLQGAAIAQRRDQISVELLERELAIAGQMNAIRVQTAQAQAAEASVRYQAKLQEMGIREQQFLFEQKMQQLQETNTRMSVLGQGPVDAGDGQYFVATPIEGSDRVETAKVGPDDPRVKRFLEQQELETDTERTKNEVMRARALAELQRYGGGVDPTQMRLQEKEVRQQFDQLQGMFKGEAYNGPPELEEEMRERRSRLGRQIAQGGAGSSGMPAGGGMAPDIISGISEELGVPPQAVAQNLDALVKMRAFQALRQNQPFDAEAESRRILNRALAQPNEPDAQQILRYLKTGTFQ